MVVLANLSGFDGSPESLRRLQLEYGAEIGRAIVNFDGPIVLCVISRYHGGAFVVFSGRLNDRMQVLAVEGAHASVIGGAPAAAVVFTREVDARTQADARVARPRAGAGRRRRHPTGARLRAELDAVRASCATRCSARSPPTSTAIHSVERAREVGSVHEIVGAVPIAPRACTTRCAGASPSEQVRLRRFRRVRTVPRPHLTRALVVLALAGAVLAGCDDDSGDGDGDAAEATTETEARADRGPRFCDAYLEYLAEPSGDHLATVVEAADDPQVDELGAIIGEDDRTGRVLAADDDLRTLARDRCQAEWIGAAQGGGDTGRRGAGLPRRARRRRPHRRPQRRARPTPSPCSSRGRPIVPDEAGRHAVPARDR